MTRTLALKLKFELERPLKRTINLLQNAIKTKFSLISCVTTERISF